MAAHTAPASAQAAGNADFVPTAALTRLRWWMTTKASRGPGPFLMQPRMNRVTG
jgi:hypothetical protein